MGYYGFQTIVVYLTLALCMIPLCWMSAKEKNNWWWIIAIIIYSLIFSVRYGVGVDSPQYVKSYLSAVNGFYDFNIKRWEPLFRYVSIGMVKLHMSHVWFLFLWAFAPLFCVFWSLRRFRDVYPYLAFTFIFGAIWLSYANGLRQIMAFGFVALSVPYLWNRKLWPFLTCVVLAALCHKSAVIIGLLPLLYFRRKTYFHNRTVQFVALAVSIGLMNIDLVQNLWEQFDTVITYFEYDFYRNTEYAEMAKFEIGAGFFVNLAINIFIIYYSNLTKRTFPRSEVALIYDFAFIGILVNYAFLAFQIVGRLNYYFYGFNYIMGAFTLFALIRNKRQYAYIALIMLYVLVFVATLYRMEENTALFRFYWEVNNMR